jgi:hypothetical protein
MNMLLIFFAAIIHKMTKDADPNCVLKSRFSAARLRDIVLGFKYPRRILVIDRGWGVLLDICVFSAPNGLPTG